LRFIDWIWHIRGSLPLAAEQSSDEALDRLDPLFCEYGTTHERTRDMLTFRKKDQAAQDKMSVFDNGVLQIDQKAGGSVLRYDLTSRILLFCFLAPLMFLAFAQLTVAMGNWQAATEAAGKSTKTKDAIKALVKKNADVPMNPVDKFLGAPAPEKPKDGENSNKRAAKKPSPTPAYVFAAIFAVLYLGGRILEDRLVKSLFRKRLLAV
jgi:hypothetical protein